MRRLTIKVISLCGRCSALLLLLPITFALATCAGEQESSIVVTESPPVSSVSGSLTELVGLETLGGLFTTLLEKGCKVPCVTTKVFSTAEDNQGEISIILYQGESELVADANYLGRFEVSGISPAPRGEPRVEITFRATSKQITISAGSDKSSHTISVSRADK